MCFSAIFLLAMPVQAQSARDMMNRITRLENEIETLSRALYRGETPPPGTLPNGNSGGDAAGTEVRLQQIEQEMRDLRGKLEEQSYQVQQMQTQMAKLMDDMQMRLQDLEQGKPVGAATTTPASPAATLTGTESSTYQWNSSGAEAGATPPPPPAAAPTTPSAPVGGSLPSEDQVAAAYENAFSLLKDGRNDEAQAGFSTFLKDNPNHPLAENAQYWLGESYYAKGDFVAAARTFAEGYQRFPKGSKAADNLLKLGLSLAEQGKKADACIALSQIASQFPNGAGPVVNRAAQEKARLGC
ncbi:MAG: tol-pal system protein YbgF [Alphaproteobacteria bacterium]|nr:tol-pal system protein YbgF [Alphaproteobacteria bacterium]